MYSLARRKPLSGYVSGGLGTSFRLADYHSELPMMVSDLLQPLVDSPRLCLSSLWWLS